MTIGTQFKDILKKKGIGKNMSKHLSSDDIQFALTHFLSSDIPIATKSTLLTAWAMLPATEDEKKAWTTLQTNLSHLPPELHFLVTKDRNPSNFFDQCIYQLMDEKSLPTNELWACLDAIHTGDMPSYKAASLFEALRLKEETFEENQTCLHFYTQKTTKITLGIPLLIDMATAYDGFNRSYFLQPFVAALLAAIGIPCLLHGVKDVSPKNGMNTHKLFLMANKNPLASMDQVAATICDPEIGWGYADQSVFCPALNALIPTRIDMIKRPVLSAIEKWLRPLNADRTVCLTGFTHAPYKQKTIDLVHHSKQYSDLILLRGVEGSTLFPHDRRTPFIVSTGDTPPTFNFISPGTFDLKIATIDPQNPDQSLALGIKALQGKHRALQAYLCYQCLAIGHALGKPPGPLATQLSQAISSGKALAHWKALM
jgi:anthranilate phosphoribosyltransferase